MLIRAEMHGLKLGNHAAIDPGQPRVRWRLELGQFDQGQQVGGSGCQSLVRVSQIQQPWVLILQPGQIDAAVSGLEQGLVGIAH